MRIVSLSPLWHEELAPLLDSGLRVTLVDGNDRPARDAALAAAEILLSARFTAEMGCACRRLRLLICPAAGTDEIDRAALPSDVMLVKGTGHEIPVAEYVMGAIIALRQRVFESDAALRRGEWLFGFHSLAGMLEELHGSNLGMVGFGGIGSQAAVRAAAFDMQCAAVTLHPEKQRAGAAALQFLGSLSRAVDVDKLVAWADALVLCCELSSLTRGLIDARRFSLMKPSALLVNVARGPVAVEQDLYDALAGKRIAGAALDVWYRYPERSQATRLPSDLPFHKLDNVILTPHASGWTGQAKQRRLAWIAKAINDFARASARTRG